ncbi:PIN domain-like protein, partial [Coniophora puteana RWD-64-598 SS2]
VCPVFRHNHANAGQNPELRALLGKLGCLVRLPVLPHFVFDGADRPKVKRGKTVERNVPHYLTNGFCSLIKAFGFTYLWAPGEAEAELAAMNKYTVVDAVMTNDSDAFVFGTRRLVRQLVKVYTVGRIQEKTGLSNDALLLIALVRGGDYDTVGLKGAGIELAYEIASHTSLAEKLGAMIRGESFDRFADSLAGWRNEFREVLSLNRLGVLSRRHPHVASDISEAFPSFNVLRSYVSPQTSWS